MLAPVVLALAVTAGCAARAPQVRPLAAESRLPLAMLPLENLTGRAENGERFSRLVWATVGRTGRYDLVDAGEVEAALAELRIRSSGSLSREQVARAAERLGVRWILAGSLLECGSIHSPDGDVPSFGLTLRLFDGRTGRVVWADMSARTGQDRETVFGWGREDYLERLADATTSELIERMRIPTTTDSLSITEGKP
jgi:TolB-like protein